MKFTKVDNTGDHSHRIGDLNTGTVIQYIHGLYIKVSLRLHSEAYTISHNRDLCLLVNLATGSLRTYTQTLEFTRLQVTYITVLNNNT